MPVVTRLQVAPVKALAALSRSEILLEAGGVAEDRRVLLLQADGAVATLRKHPALSRCVPDLDLAAGTLTVAFPDGSTARTELADAGRSREARLFGKDRVGRELPGAVAEALSAFAGEPLQPVLAETTGVGWDEAPVSLVSVASAAATGVPAETASRRLRMLIEIDGVDAFAEDGWAGRSLTLGQARIGVQRPLGRCVVIERSPDTGTKDWAGLRELARLRGRGPLTLGVIASVEQPGRIRVGDAVEIA